MSVAIYTLLLFLAPASPEQRPLDEPMTTDRPFLAVTPDVPELGRFQAESGLAWRQAGENDTYRLGEGLFRLGMAGGGELRIHTPAYVDDGVAPEGRTGFTDVVVGYKKRLGTGGGARPSTALVVESTLPTGSAGLRSSKPLPRADLAAAWQLGRARLRTAAGYARRPASENEGAEDASHGEWHGGAALEVRLSRPTLLSRRWTAYLEIWGLDDDVRGGSSLLQGGILYRFYDFQVDVRVGRGLNGEDDETLAGAGLTIKW